ncbi:MAG: hypothetical protein HZA15_08760 [Nitrospirae bacterium]|nr:hypothetical protein [Nitrospirota bacterium]
MDLHRIITKIIVPAYVELTNNLIVYKPWLGFKKRISTESLQTIQIETTDKGPLFEDFFMVLITNKSVIRIAQEIKGFDHLLSELQKLPGFDNEAVIKASTCVDNAVFNVWKKESLNKPIEADPK